MKSKLNMSFDEHVMSTQKGKDIILTNPSVIHDNIIDPWDPCLSPHHKDEVMKACAENIWYFLRYVVKIRQPLGNRLFNFMDFHLNDATIAFIWLYQQKQSAILLGTRQIIQKTTALDALYLYQFLFGSRNETPVYLPVPFTQKEFFMKRIKVPEYILDPNIDLHRNAINKADSMERPGEEFIYFVDDIMHHNFYSEYHDDNIRNMKNPYYGVGTIGPYNAEIVRYTIPFTDTMYDKDIESFGEDFIRFTGYRPSYLILLGTDDFVHNDEYREWLNTYRDHITDDCYRKEFEIIPDWKM